MLPDVTVQGIQLSIFHHYGRGKRYIEIQIANQNKSDLNQWVRACYIEINFFIVNA